MAASTAALERAAGYADAVQMIVRRDTAEPGPAIVGIENSDSAAASQCDTAKESAGNTAVAVENVDVGVGEVVDENTRYKVRSATERHHVSAAVSV